MSDFKVRPTFNGANVLVAGDTISSVGLVAHDALATGTNPLLVGGYASAVAPADVGADGRAVRAWMLRNGAQVIGPATSLATTAAWTSATAIDTAISRSVIGSSGAVVTLNPTTTFTGGAINFEASDDGGTTWYPITALRNDSGHVEKAFTIVASTKRSWRIDASGWTDIRVRLNPVIAGTGTANVSIRSSGGDKPPVVVRPFNTLTATQSSVAGSASSVALQAANVDRKSLIIYNDSTSALYVAFGVTASATVFTYKLQPGATLELCTPVYTGAVNGIWDSATGNARITEMT